MDKFKELRERCESCTDCSLHATRTNCVFGKGNPAADLMFIGEAPGEQEDLTGEPFVGEPATARPVSLCRRH